jgi:hypothetical protein
VSYAHIKEPLYIYLQTPLFLPTSKNFFPIFFPAGDPLRRYWILNNGYAKNFPHPGSVQETGGWRVGLSDVKGMTSGLLRVEEIVYR